LGLSPRRPAVGELTYGESDRLGPVAFLPPERLTSGERTKAGDLYGLGATLYYLLTTRPPHAGSSPLETLLNLQQVDPVPLESIQPDVGPAVAALVRRLLSRDPARRPDTDEVIETLLPACEPSVMPAATTAAPPVPLASETFTGGAPVAVPVARDLDHPDGPPTGPTAEPMPGDSATAIPAVEPPLVEPFSDRHLGHEVRPFDTGEGSSEHLQAFEHTVMGADRPRAPRPRVQTTGRNKAMIIAGLLLHLTGTLICLGWLGIIPNPFAARPTQDNSPKVEKKDKGKVKKNDHRTTD
jgi:hypothetical protein